MTNLTQKNIATASPAAPFGPAVLLVNVFDKERTETITASFEGYGTWKKAVCAGREALRDAVVAYYDLDVNTAKFISEDPEDCTSEAFQDQFRVRSGGCYDSNRQLLTLWVEDRWFSPDQVIAEAMVLSTPELPQVNW